MSHTAKSVSKEPGTINSLDSAPDPVHRREYSHSVSPALQLQPYPMKPQATVIEIQPTGNNDRDAVRMPVPPVNPDCPPGLEYLTLVDQLLVHQKRELLEAFVGIETANKYHVNNSMGQQVFRAAEVSGCCARICCGPLRSFEMRLVDTVGRDVIHLKRPLACVSCCFPCCLQTLEVCSPPGTVIGSIKQEWNICTPVFSPKYSLQNAAGETVLKIQGPFYIFGCCRDVKFEVLGLDGTKVGKISKQWSGLLKECCTDADNFGISFPMDLDVKMKAVLLGACFLIVTKILIIYTNLTSLPVGLHVFREKSMRLNGGLGITD